MATKPSVLLDWINDDSATKYTIPSAPSQLAGHISDTAADPKIFNFCWWRLSQWIEFLDSTFNANGKDLNAANSTTITETISPAASTVTLDAGGIKSWDGSSNAIFSVTESGVVTIGYNSNDIISLTAGVLSVATATAADLVKLHALTPSAADLNHLLGANGNGLVAADITKLAALTPSALDLNHLAGANGNGLVAADITKLAAVDSSAAELNLLNSVSGLVKADFTKLAAMTPSALDINTLLGANGNGLIVADLTKLANIDASDTEIDQLDGVTVGGTSAGDIATINDIQIFTNKTLTSPKINEDVVLGATSTELDAAVAYAVSGLSEGISSYDITESISAVDKPGLIQWDKYGFLVSAPHDPLIPIFMLQSEKRSEGTATSTSTDKLIDTNADFSTDGVIIDDWIFNTTDNTYARVTAVDSSTSLSIDTDIFISGEDYIITSKYTGKITIGSGSEHATFDPQTFKLTVRADSITANALLKLAPLASAPSSPTEGVFWMDANTHILKIHNGTTWKACYA